MKTFLKKFLISLVITIILGLVLYFLLQRYEQLGDIMDWIELNFGYAILLIISVVFGLTFLQYDTRSSRVMFMTLIIINFAVGILIFSQGIGGFSLIEIGVLGGGIGLAFLLMLIHHRIKYVLIILVVIGIFTILLLKILPIYDEAPDVQGFVNSQKVILKSIVSEGNTVKTTATIIEENGEKSFDLLSQNEDINLDLKSKTTITLACDTYHENAELGFVFPDGTDVILFPQSVMKIPVQNTSNSNGGQIEFLLGKLWFISTDNVVKDKIFSVKTRGVQIVASSGVLVQLGQNILVKLSDDGKIFSGMQLLQTGTQFTIGQYGEINPWYLGQKITLSTGVLNIEKNLYKEYNEELKLYLIEQAGGDIVLNPAADWFVEKFLSLMFSIYPKRYGRNLLNYYSFGKYFGEIKGVTLKINSGNTEEIKNSVEKKTMEGLEGTKIFEWWRKLMNN